MSQTSTPEPPQQGASEETGAPAETAPGGPPEAAESAEPSLPLDQIFDVLRNERRRVVLRFLADADGAVSMSDLSEAVAAYENDKPVSHLSSDERKRVYVGLYQCHLPKMDSMDIVDFNKPRGMVELAENHRLVQPYLQDDTDEDVDGGRWARRYLLLSGLGLLALALAVGAGGGLLVQAAFGLIVAGFTVCSVAYWHTVRETADDDEDGSGD